MKRFALCFKHLQHIHNNWSLAFIRSFLALNYSMALRVFARLFLSGIGMLSISPLRPLHYHAVSPLSFMTAASSQA
jgi:hypothetical protein